MGTPRRTPNHDLESKIDFVFGLTMRILETRHVHARPRPHAAWRARTCLENSIGLRAFRRIGFKVDGLMQILPEVLETEMLASERFYFVEAAGNLNTNGEGDFFRRMHGCGIYSDRRKSR